MINLFLFAMLLSQSNPVNPNMDDGWGYNSLQSITFTAGVPIGDSDLDLFAHHRVEILPQAQQAPSFNSINSSLQSLITSHEQSDSETEDESEFNYWKSFWLLRDTNSTEVKTALTNYQNTTPKKGIQDYAAWLPVAGLAGDAPYKSCWGINVNSGRINKIVFIDSTTMLLGLCGAMVKRNNKTGTITQMPSLNGYFSSGISCIAIAPSNPKYIYVGSGYGVNNNIWGNFFSSCTGIYTTTNGSTFKPSGINWGWQSNQVLTSIEVAHKNAKRVFACSHAYPTDEHLWHSEDGVTFADDSYKVPGTDKFFENVKYSPDGKTLFLSGHHLYKSTDEGNSWVCIDNMLTGFVLDTTTSNSMLLLAAVPSGCPAYYNKCMVAFSMNLDGTTNTWITFDGFSTVCPKHSGNSVIGNTGSDLCKVWGLHPPVIAVGVNPPQGITIYLGGIIFGYWQYPSTVEFKWTYAHPDIRCITAGSNGDAWVGTDGGLYHFINGTMTPANQGINAGLYYSVDQSSNGSLGIGTQDNAEKIQENGAFENYYGGDCGNVTFDLDDPSKWFGEDFQKFGSIYSGSYENCENTFYGNDTLFHFSPIPTYLESDNQRFIFGMHNLWYYDNINGGYYQLTDFAKWYGFDCGAITSIAGYGQTLVVSTQGVWMLNGIASQDYNNPQGYEGYNLFISYDRGANWTDISPQLKAVKGVITSIGLFGKLGEDVYITWGGYTDLNGSNENVFYCQSPTVTHDIWAAVNAGLPKMPTTKIVTDANANLYLATDAGTYMTNAGFNYKWKGFNAGIPLTRVTDIKVLGNELYASTYGRGLWESSLYNSQPQEELASGADSVFPLHNCKWTIEYNFWDYETDPYTHQYSVADYFPLKDTSFSGHVWTKLGNELGTICFARVDGSKVHAYALPGNRLGLPDQTVMDFSLKVGDTLWGIYGGTDVTENIYCWVDTVNSVLLADGKFHKRLHIATNAFPYRDTTSWIEGVGDTHGLFEWLYCTASSEESFDYELTCFDEDSTQIYSVPSPSGKFDCDTKITTGIETQSQNDIIAYSENGKIIVKNNSEHGGTVTIYDVLGRSYYYSILPANTYNIVPLHAGTYIVNWISDQGIIESKKVIVL